MREGEDILIVIAQRPVIQGDESVILVADDYVFVQWMSLWRIKDVDDEHTRDKGCCRGWGVSLGGCWQRAGDRRCAGGGSGNRDRTGWRWGQ